MNEGKGLYMREKSDAEDVHEGGYQENGPIYESAVPVMGDIRFDVEGQQTLDLGGCYVCSTGGN